MAHNKLVRVQTILTLVARLTFVTIGLAATVAPLVLVSGPSPFAGCTLGATATGTIYVNAEVEPYVAVNPTNAQNLIGVWQQDRWSDGGAHGLASSHPLIDGRQSHGGTPA